MIDTLILRCLQRFSFPKHLLHQNTRQVVSQKFATFITTVFIVYMLTAKQKYPKGICAAFPDQATLIVCRSALRGPPERPFRSFFYGGPQTGFSLKRVCPFQTHSWEKPRGHITSFLWHPALALVAHFSLRMLCYAANMYFHREIGEALSWYCFSCIRCCHSFLCLCKMKPSVALTHALAHMCLPTSTAD